MTRKVIYWANRCVSYAGLSIRPLGLHKEAESAFELLRSFLTFGWLRALLTIFLFFFVLFFISLSLQMRAVSLRVLFFADRSATSVNGRRWCGPWTVIEVIFVEEVLELRSDVPYLQDKEMRSEVKELKFIAAYIAKSIMKGWWDELRSQSLQHQKLFKFYKFNICSVCEQENEVERVTCFVSSCCFSFTATSNTFSSVCLLLISGWLLVNSLTTLLMPSGPALLSILIDSIWVSVSVSASVSIGVRNDDTI